MEIIGDSTCFGSGDFELFIAYSPDVGKACSLTPLKLRRLKWRQANPGDPLSAADKQTFLETGFATKTRMAAYDMLVALNQKLSREFPTSSLNLGSFALPEMSRIPPNFKKIWLGDQWVRQPFGPAEVAGRSHPQLPPEILDMFANGRLRFLKELGITWDSASWDISASNFMRSSPPNGLGLNGEDCEDVYHRSWNNFKSAMDICKITPSSIAMPLVFMQACFYWFEA